MRTKKQFNFLFVDEVRRKIASAKELTHADSFAETVRRAVFVYEYMAAEAVLGAKITICRPDGTSKEVVLL